ncbi:MAG: FAD-dependent oxidoreductase [Pseudomonadota bacterium]
MAIASEATTAIRDQRPGLELQRAIEEATRCLLCHDAPCSAACPAGTDPARFVRQIRFFNLKGAARTVLGNNPFAGVCARVCATERTCAAACLRAGLDRAVDIAGLQRFAVEHGRRVGVQPHTTDATRRPRTARIAVIGAGPAGLSAAAELAGLGYRATVFDAHSEPGGMLRHGLPEHRLPGRVLADDLAAIIGLGVELECSQSLAGGGAAARLLDRGFAAVFVATGLGRARTLAVPGSELTGVTTALAFLADARTDVERARALVAGQNVAVVGGGSVAMDVACTSRRLGANRVYAIALEASDELPAAAAELDLARHDRVIIKPQCMITRVLGDDGRVAGVEGVETEWIEPGRPVPSNARPLPDTHFRLQVGAVVIAIGQCTAESSLRCLDADRRGDLLVVSERTMTTSVARVFAGGDAVRGPATVVRAVADGKRAAAAIHELLTAEVQR